MPGMLVSAAEEGRPGAEGAVPVPLSAPSCRGVRLPIHRLFGFSAVMVFVLFRSVRLAKSSVNQSLSGPQDQAPCASEKARKREVTAMPHEVLRKILPVVGWSEDQAAAVAFTGGSDPVLPTPFR